MSLINDALKQIKQARQQDPPSSRPPLLPVESARSREGFRWFVPAVVVLLLATAGVFVGISLSKSTQLAASGMPAKMESAPAARQLQSAAVSSVVTQRTERLSVAEPAAQKASPGSTAAVVALARPPELKLQGILFASTGPCAIVNGRTVYTGDRVNDFRVTIISRDSITLRSETETRVLSLNPQ